MPATPDARLTGTSLREKLLNIFVAPGDVFEEVVASPPKAACWLAPTFVVFLAGFIALLVAPVQERRAAEDRQPVETGPIVSSETGKLRLSPAAVLIVATSAVA